MSSLDRQLKGAQQRSKTRFVFQRGEFGIERHARSSHHYSSKREPRLRGAEGFRLAQP
jgi:hypothetical protein